MTIEKRIGVIVDKSNAKEKRAQIILPLMPPRFKEVYCKEIPFSKCNYDCPRCEYLPDFFRKK